MSRAQVARSENRSATPSTRRRADGVQAVPQSWAEKPRHLIYALIVALTHETYLSALRFSSLLSLM